MKRILSFILFALLLLPLEGQIGRYPFYTSSGPRTYATVLNDGNTLFWGKVSTDYMTVSNDSIAEWTDALGGSISLTAPGDARPVIISDSIYFDGTDDVLAVTNTAINQPLFFYIVLSQQSWADEDGLFGGATSVSVYTKQDYDTPGFRAYAGAASSRLTNLGILEKGIIRCLFNSASSLLIVNEESGSAVTNFGTNDPNGINIGKGGSGLGNGSIAVWEVIIRSSADSDGDQALLMDYLQSEHGL